MKLVILESPFAGDIKKNIAFARLCIRDCLRRGEAPIASHLLFTQPGVLDDSNPKERQLGIDAGHEWMKVADLVVVYTDHGISGGMKAGIVSAEKHGRTVEYRRLIEIEIKGDEESRYKNSSEEYSQWISSTKSKLNATTVENEPPSTPSEK